MITNAFIFARGGSKGLSRKNVKLLGGKPLIEHSIHVAKQLQDIHRVFVSTDDDEIASISKRAGAIVIQRPKELATDACAEWLAWRHAINYVITEYGGFDLFVSLPPTSPLRHQKDILAGLDSFSRNKADVCISITSANRNPFFNMVQKTQSGYLEIASKLDIKITRRQDAPKIFDITTVFYIAKPEFILKNDSLFEGKVIGIEIPKVRAIDIDDIYDFMLAEAIISSQSSNHV